MLLTDPPFAEAATALPSMVQIILSEAVRDEPPERFIRTTLRERQFAVLPDGDVPASTEPRLVVQFARDRVSIQRHAPNLFARCAPGSWGWTMIR
jgi:hypothetical protein